MNKEFLEVVDENGNPTGGVFERDTIHEKNLFHKHAGIFIFNNKGQTLLQKRSANKKNSPNKWHICAGHVGAYEDNITALLRELQEEMGIEVKPDEITPFFTMVKRKELGSHITYYYYMFLDKAESEFKIQEEEVSEVKWVPFDKFKNMVINNDESVVLSNDEDTIRVINILEDMLNEH